MLHDFSRHGIGLTRTGGGLAIKMLIVIILLLLQLKFIISVIFNNVKFLHPAGYRTGISFEQSDNLVYRLAILTILL